MCVCALITCTCTCTWKCVCVYACICIPFTTSQPTMIEHSIRTPAASRDTTVCLRWPDRAGILYGTNYTCVWQLTSGKHTVQNSGLDSLEPHQGWLFGDAYRSCYAVENANGKTFAKAKVSIARCLQEHVCCLLSNWTHWLGKQGK